MPINWGRFKNREKDSDVDVQQETESENEESVSSNTALMSAATRNQLMRYFENAEARGLKTEMMISELKQAVEQNSERVDSLINAGAENTDRIESSIHKDNLLSFKSVKEELASFKDTVRAENNESFGKIKLFATIAAISSTLAAIVAIISLIVK